jgi:hypothetical protein
MQTVTRDGAGVEGARGFRPARAGMTPSSFAWRCRDSPESRLDSFERLALCDRRFHLAGIMKKTIAVRGKRGPATVFAVDRREQLQHLVA